LVVLKKGFQMNTGAKQKVDLLTHNRQVIEEAKSSLNLWGTGEEFHHPPNQDTVAGRNELFEHYIHAGGPKHLEAEHCIAA
jgi:hypothetical protein